MVYDNKDHYGLYQGVVTNIDDPEKRGRIKVLCPDVLGSETESAWCDPLVQVAYDTGGDFCIPAVDEAVWIQFVAGDVNRPVYMGGWWSKDKTPLGTDYSSADSVRIISYSDCTIIMQDGKIKINVGGGSGDLQIEDNNITINGDLKVTGKVTSDSVDTSSVKASSGNISSLNTTNITNAENITTKSIKVTTVNSTEIDNVDVIKTRAFSSRSVSAQNIDATGYVQASTVTAGDVSLKGHTHKVLDGDVTDKPEQAS